MKFGKWVLARSGGMLKKYIWKFAMDIFPSVAATIIGAYIVNHYIAKPASDPPAVSAAAPTQVKKAESATDRSQPKTSESKSVDAGPGDIKAAENSAGAVNSPEP